MRRTLSLGRPTGRSRFNSIGADPSTSARATVTGTLLSNGFIETPKVVYSDTDFFLTGDLVGTLRSWSLELVRYLASPPTLARVRSIYPRH